MKKFTILLMAVLTTGSTALTAQVSSIPASNSSNVKTQRKIYSNSSHPASTTIPYGSRGYLGSELMRSQKEQMKMQVVKFYTCRLHPTVVSDEPGRCTRCGTLMNRSTKETMKMEVTKTYTGPMYPGVPGNTAGKCPKCGMNHGEAKKPAVSYTCRMHQDGIIGSRMRYTNCGSDLLRSPKEKMKMEVMKQYSCPMDAAFTSDKPGKCCCSTDS